MTAAIKEIGRQAPWRRRVLLAEDDDDVREFCRSLLVANGYDVLEARDGEEALRLYRASPCEVVVLDLFMPRKEGLETIRELRASAPSVKILAISGRLHEDGQDLLAAASTLGADLALRKPFAGIAFIRAIDEMLGGPPGR